jgi:outer membrane autotransporter protein
LINRLNEINTFTAIEVASGDADTRFKPGGLWVSGIYGLSKQQTTTNAVGYSGKSHGAAIGFDFDINDNVVLGFAYSKINSKLRFHKLLTGDNMNVSSNIFSIYNKIDISNNITFRGIASYSEAITKYDSNRLLSANYYKNAQGRFKTKDFSSFINFAYNARIKESILVSPNIGLKYNAQHDGNYSESGAGLYNISMPSKRSKNLFATTGIEVSFIKTLSNGIALMPSLNSSVERVIFSKCQKTASKFTWSNESLQQDITSSKEPKYAFNIGSSISLKKNNLEMIAGYDCHIKHQYIGHQGSLKLRLNL